jgi:hypothetical protein
MTPVRDRASRRTGDAEHPGDPLGRDDSLQQTAGSDVIAGPTASDDDEEHDNRHQVRTGRGQAGPPPAAVADMTEQPAA